MHRVLLLSVASLALLANLARADTVTLTFSGRIDGSDTIDVTPTQATWDHTFFGFPTGVDFDGQSWDPQTSATLSDAGSPFIPSDLSDYRANVVQTAGRDQIAAEIDGNDLQIHLADTPNGDDLYTFQVVLTKEPPRVPTAQTLLHVQGTIDGSDRVVITNAGATLDHYFWGTPTSMSLNGVAWDPSVQSTLSNSGATTFLPNTVDLSSATFVKNEGRDLASFEVFNDHVDLIFADNPLGSSNYDVTLSFSSPVPEPGTAVLALSAILTTAWGLLGRRRRAIGS